MTSLLAIAKTLPSVSLPAGAVLVPEGEHTGVLFILLEGSVDILKGDVLIDTVSEPGALFGEISALLDTPHMATVRAATPVHVVRIEDAPTFLGAHPDLALDIARLLAARLSNVVAYLADLKRQFAGHSHLAMVDEVLDALVHQQRQPFTPGSSREPDPNR